MHDAKEVEILGTNLALEEDTENTTTSALSTSLLVCHDTARRGEHDVSDLTRRKEKGNPFLNLVKTHVEARRDDGALVETTVELNNNLAGTVVIHFLKLANVAWSQLVIAFCTKT